MEADSDDDDDDEGGHELLIKMEDVDSKDDKSQLKPEDAQFSSELADSVNRIRVCFRLPQGNVINNSWLWCDVTLRLLS